MFSTFLHLPEFHKILRFNILFTISIYKNNLNLLNFYIQR